MFLNLLGPKSPDRSTSVLKLLQTHLTSPLRQHSALPFPSVMAFAMLINLTRLPNSPFMPVKSPSDTHILRSSLATRLPATSETDLKPLPRLSDLSRALPRSEYTSLLSPPDVTITVHDTPDLGRDGAACICVRPLRFRAIRSWT